MSPKTLARTSRGVLAMALAIGLQVGVLDSSQASQTDAHPVVLNVKYKHVAETTFAYAELGKGRLLLMLNGTGSPMNEWDPRLLDDLAKSHRVLVFDYPGLGLSGKAPSPWHFASAADWIAEFAQTMSSEPMDVLGWSMGGFVAQQLAVRHPGLVHRLVLAATNPGGKSTTLGPMWVQQADSNPIETDAGFLATNFPRTQQAQEAGRAFLQRLERAVDSGAYPEEDVPAATYRAMVRAEDPWLRSERNTQALTMLHVPALVITGAKDVITPPANTARLKSLIPGAHMKLVPGSGHSFLFQDPASAAEAFTEFLLGS